MKVRFEVLATLLLPCALASVAGPPWRDSARGEHSTALLVAALSLLAWACAAWLLVVLALTWVSDHGVPGASWLLHRVAPRSVRLLARIALGIGVATAGATPALAEQPSPAIDLDWGSPAPALPAYHPVARPPVEAVAATPVAVPVAVGRVVVVRPGDSLWRIAARGLGPGATTAQVAQSWPTWWVANRDVLGDDPDLIHPGAVLRVPPAAGAS